MQKDAILIKLTEVFREVFDLDDVVITPDTVADDIEEWDSLEHTPSLWDIVDKKKEGVVGYHEYKVHNGKPCVFVDEPYFKPALATYQAVGGYRTERKTWKGNKWYNIYLV